MFAWLYFKDRLSTRSNLHAKHVLDSDQCQRCAGSIEDKHHTFFGCAVSASVWRKIGFGSVSSLTDKDVWNFATPPGLDAKLCLLFFLLYSRAYGMPGMVKSFVENTLIAGRS